MHCSSAVRLAAAPAAVAIHIDARRQIAFGCFLLGQGRKQYAVKSSSTRQAHRTRRRSVLEGGEETNSGASETHG
jgi:hypothetical protein